MKQAGPSKRNITAYGGPAARGSALMRLGHLRLEILLPIHTNELEEIAQRERADEQAQQPEIVHAGDGADQRDERMNRGKAAVDEGPGEIVEELCDENPPQDEQYAGYLSTLHEQRNPGRDPYQPAADDGEDGEC